MKLINKSQCLRLLDVMREDATGTLKDALFSLRQLAQAQHESSPEIQAELAQIFAGDEYDRLGRMWKERGGVPPDGARVFCLRNEKTQKWEPEFPPPEAA
jgi:hypothetical protein